MDGIGASLILLMIMTKYEHLLAIKIKTSRIVSSPILLL